MRQSQSPPTPALHIYNHNAVCQLCIVENMFWKKIVGESNSFWKIVILSTFKSGLVERLKHRHCKLENHERKQENGKKIHFVHLLQFVKSILTLLITALLRVKLNLSVQITLFFFPPPRTYVECFFLSAFWPLLCRHDACGCFCALFESLGLCLPCCLEMRYWMQMTLAQLHYICFAHTDFHSFTKQF